MLLWDRLFGKRDILIPYFDFSKVLRGNMESFILKEIYKLRYEVYCLECEYLQAKDFDEGLESDDYDDCSIHFAAYTLDHNIVGTVRLVQPGEHQVYPFEGHCKVFDDFTLPPRANAAEISRLVVRKTFRRRRGDSMEGISKDFVEKGTTAGIQPPTANEKRGNSPLLLLGMYREMYRHSRAHGIRFWYAAMERSLARLTRQIQDGDQAGEGKERATDRHGLGSPAVANPQKEHDQHGGQVLQQQRHSHIESFDGQEIAELAGADAEKPKEQDRLPVAGQQRPLATHDQQRGNQQHQCCACHAQRHRRGGTPARLQQRLGERTRQAEDRR